MFIVFQLVNHLLSRPMVSMANCYMESSRGYWVYHFYDNHFILKPHSLILFHRKSHQTWPDSANFVCALRVYWESIPESMLWPSWKRDGVWFLGQESPLKFLGSLPPRLCERFWHYSPWSRMNMNGNRWEYTLCGNTLFIDCWFMVFYGSSFPGL